MKAPATLREVDLKHREQHAHGINKRVVMRIFIHIFCCHIKTNCIYIYVYTYILLSHQNKKTHQILYLASLLKEIIHPNAVKGLPCCKKWAYSVGNSTHMGGFGIMDVGKKNNMSMILVRHHPSSEFKDPAAQTDFSTCKSMFHVQMAESSPHHEHPRSS